MSLLRNVRFGIAFAAVMLVTLSGCAAGGAPETVVVTSTQFVEPDPDTAEPDAAEQVAGEAEEVPEPEAAPAAGGFALDPAYADKIGGDCGYTPDGFAIHAGPDTSCAFAAEVYPRAIAATYSMTNNPNVTSLPKATLSGVPSPATGQTYDLSCSVGSDGQDLSCMGDGHSPLVSFNDPNRGWRSRIAIS